MLYPEYLRTWFWNDSDEHCDDCPDWTERCLMVCDDSLFWCPLRQRPRCREEYRGLSCWERHHHSLRLPRHSERPLPRTTEA